MKIKTKIILTILIFIFGSVFSLFLTASLSEVLAHETTTLRFIPPGECIAKLASDRQSLMMFLCFDGFFLMLGLLLITTNTKPYRSDLVTITPDIKIPAAVGQYQHGSAHFLTSKEKDKAFDSFILDPMQKQIKHLIKTGYEDLDFLKGKNDEHSESSGPAPTPEPESPPESGEQTA